MSDAGQDEPRHNRFRFPVWGLIPPVVAALLFGVFFWGLFNPSPNLRSVLIGKPVPEFVLPPITGRTEGFATADLKGKVAVVNVFASWCVPCRAEHPFVTELARSGVPVYGINHKDKAADALAWLAELGYPYTRIGADTDGRVSIEFGVYGLPETFVVASDGTIAYRVVGAITRETMDQTLLPLIRDLQRKAGGKTE